MFGAMNSPESWGSLIGNDLHSPQLLHGTQVIE